MRRSTRRIALAGLIVLATLFADPAVQACQVDGTRNKIAGVAISSRRTPRPLSSMIPDFPRLRAIGANVVSIDVWWFVDGMHDSTVAPIPGLTTSDAELEQTIAAARANGLRVALTLKLGIGTALNGWRGDYVAPDTAAFFQTYRQATDHYADLAERARVWLYYPASEMESMAVHEAEWRAIIASVRSRFLGRVTYEANFPTAHAVRFWDVLDYVSLSAYMPVSDKARPTVADMVWGWHDYHGRRWVDELAWLSATTGKRILFGEAGYHASTYPAYQPYRSAPQGVYDPGLQAAAYQALLEVFDDKAWWAGVLWWAWDPGFNTRSFDNKPAESLLKRWYVDGWRPGNRHVSVVPEVPAAWPTGAAVRSHCV